jgi:hypothetical protein
MIDFYGMCGADTVELPGPNIRVPDATPPDNRFLRLVRNTGKPHYTFVSAGKVSPAHWVRIVEGKWHQSK